MVLPFPVLINDVCLCVRCKHYISESALAKSLGGCGGGHGGRQGVSGQVLDSSRGRGMTREGSGVGGDGSRLGGRDDGEGGGVALGNHEALALQGGPPLDPSTRLPPQRICDRVSGPTPPWDGFLPRQDDGEGAVGEGREGVWVSRWGGGVWRCGARIRRIRRPAIDAPRGRAFLRRVLRGCEPVCPGCRRAI